MESSAISLIMVKGPREGETLDFPPGTTIRIGRTVRGNSVAIKDAGISTKHLSIESESVSGKWMLLDLDSSNGTFVNDTKLPPHDAFALSDGDTIKCGELTSILVRINSNEECGSRRNPRRKAAEKCTSFDVMGSVAGTRGRRGKVVEVVSVVGGCNDTMLESGRCLRSRKGRGVKALIKVKERKKKKMASSKFLIIAFMATLALSSIHFGQAARHLLQTTSPLVPNLPVIPTGIPPLPALPNPTTLPNLPQPTLPKLNLPPLPSSPVNIPSGLALPPLPTMALPNFPSIPTIPTSFPSIPFLSPPPATSSSP